LFTPQHIFLIIVFSSDAELEGRLDKMEGLDEFEPDELHGGLVFSEDEEDLVDPDDKDDW
jgi:hypothetical protein